MKEILMEIEENKDNYHYFTINDNLFAHFGQTDLSVMKKVSIRNFCNQIIKVNYWSLWYKVVNLIAVATTTK